MLLMIVAAIMLLPAPDVNVTEFDVESAINGTHAIDEDQSQDQDSRDDPLRTLHNIKFPLTNKHDKTSWRVFKIKSKVRTHDTNSNSQ